MAVDFAELGLRLRSLGNCIVREEKTGAVEIKDSDLKANAFIGAASRVLAASKEAGKYYIKNFGAPDAISLLVGGTAYFCSDAIHPYVVQHIVPTVQPTIDAGLNMIPQSADFLNLHFIGNLNNKDALYPQAEMSSFYLSLLVNNYLNIRQENSEAGSRRSRTGCLLSAAGRTLANIGIGELAVLPLQEGYVNAGNSMIANSGLTGNLALGVGYLTTKVLIDATYAGANGIAEFVKTKVKQGTKGVVDHWIMAGLS